MVAGEDCRYPRIDGIVSPEIQSDPQHSDEAIRRSSERRLGHRLTEPEQKCDIDGYDLSTGIALKERQTALGIYPLYRHATVPTGWTHGLRARANTGRDCRIFTHTRSGQPLVRPSEWQDYRSPATQPMLFSQHLIEPVHRRPEIG